MSTLSFLTFVLFLLQFAASKHFTRQFTVDEFENNNLFYLTKFGAHIGKTKYIFTAKVLNGYTSDKNSTLLGGQIYLDEKWDNLQNVDECERSDKANVKLSMEIPLDGQFQKEGYLAQSIRQHIWYFTFTDCQKNFYNQFKGTDAILEIDIKLFNSGDSQFSSEESGTIYFTGFLCCVNAVIFVLHFLHLLRDYQKHEETDWALLLLIFAMGIETIQNFALFVHLYNYASDGEGIETFELASEFFQVICRFVLTALIILISWGWSINFVDFKKKSLWIPIGIVVGILQVSIMGVGKLFGEETDKFHQFDGWVGYSICFVEVALLIYFFLGIKETQKESSPKVRGFIAQFAIYATLYFLGFPVLLVISKILAGYLRYKFITLGTFSVRILAIVLLAHLFTSKQSGYRDISYKNISYLDRSKFE